MSRNNFDKHVFSDKIKWVATVLAFLLLAVFVAAACTQGFTNANPWGWFDKKEKDEQAKGEMVVTPEEGDAAVAPVALSVAKIMPMDYDDYGIMPMALTAYTVTATVNDADGRAQDYLRYVDFSLAWKSTNSASLSDYITMTTTDYTATLTCKKAFTMQIILTAASTLDSTKKATVTLDYAKPLTGFSISTTKTTRPNRAGNNLTASAVSNGAAVKMLVSNWETNGATAGSSEDNGAWQYSCFKAEKSGATFGEGSIDNSVTSISASFSFSSAFLTAAKKLNTTYPNISGETYTTSSLGSLSQATLLCHMLTGSDARLYVGAEDGSGWGSGVYTVCQKFMNLLDTTDNPISVTLTINLTYGSAVKYTFNLDVDTYKAPVGTVSVGQTSHVFAN